MTALEVVMVQDGVVTIFEKSSNVTFWCQLSRLLNWEGQWQGGVLLELVADGAGGGGDGLGRLGR